MIKNKSIQLLQSLAENELPELRNFLQSPFFNTDQRLVTLLDALSPYFPDNWEKLPAKQLFFQNTWPNEKWDCKKIDYLMSDFNQLAEHYLAVNNFQSESALLKVNLLDALSKKGLQKAYRQVNRRLEKKQLSMPAPGIDGLFLLLRHAEVQEANFGRTRQRRSDQSIQNLTSSLDRYYYTYRLRLVCNMLDRQAILNTKYELFQIEYWLPHLKEQAFLGEPIIEVYYVIYQTLTNQEEEKYFQRLKYLLQEFEDRIPNQELAEIYLLSINYCLRKIRQNQVQYITEAVAIYKKGIENRALYQEGYLSPWTFTNVIKLSLGMKEYDWVEYFIEHYQNQLPPSFRENAVHYNLAELYYFREQFDQAQVHLSQVAFTDLNFYLGARELLAKIYYETNAEESLLSLLASFSIFLKRNKKISQNIKKPYLNFCQVLFKIIRESKRDQATLLEDIEHTPLLASRAWLMKIYNAEIPKD